MSAFALDAGKRRGGRRCVRVCVRGESFTRTPVPNKRGPSGLLIGFLDLVGPPRRAELIPAAVVALGLHDATVYTTSGRARRSALRMGLGKTGAPHQFR